MGNLARRHTVDHRVNLLDEFPRVHSLSHIVVRAADRVEQAVVHLPNLSEFWKFYAVGAGYRCRMRIVVEGGFNRVEFGAS